MVAEQMPGEVLAIQMTKEEICVSIIVPTHRNEPQKKADGIVLKQAVEKATNSLQQDFPKTTAGKLIETIKDLCSKADLNHHKIAWPVMRNYLDKYEDKVILEFREKIGTSAAVTGLENIWKAVMGGRGWKLLVERDFYCGGFVDMGGYNFYLQPPLVEHKKLEDAVDDLIEKTIETKGQVVFVQNDKLKDHERIGLITRY